MMKKLPRPALLGFVALAGLAFFSVAAADDRPNLLVVLADDLGWADLPSYGNRYHETPALDRLAAEGMRFTQFYSAAVCSPTRANLQSGRHEARYGITQHIPGHRRPYAKLIDPSVPLQLPLEVETIAESLGAAGYATGYFGKWHLGGPGYGPADQGWQTAFECSKHELSPELTGEDGPRRTAAYLTERAIAFMEEHRDGPFLLQVSHYAVHIPLQTLPELLAKYEEKPPVEGFPSRPDYAALLEELDASVGDLVAAVDRLGLGERTLVVFVSDNGGLVHDQAGTVYTSNAPLRGEKGTLYEGGIRVPAIFRQRGRIPSATLCEAPASTADLHATFLELAGLAGQDRSVAPALDGVSLAPLLRDPAARRERDALFWHLPHYHHSTPASAVRRGDWKLLEFFEDGALELYDLSRDLGESENLAASHPETASELRAALEAWRSDIGARLPLPNPDHDPDRADELATSPRREAKGRR
jgi:arylsulfatase A